MSRKYQPYSAYKSSGADWLDEIPEQWESFFGKRIFLNRKEVAKDKDEQLAATQQFGVVPQTMYMEQNEQKVVLALKGTSTFRHAEKNDFVISLRSFQGGIEHSEYSGCVSPAYTVLKPARAIAPRYFKYLMKSAPYIAALQSSTDSLREGKSITYDQFGAILHPYPSLDEQEAISRFLDHETVKIDRLIEKQQQLIELLKEKRQAVISHAVTKGLHPNAKMKDSGVEWLGEVPEHWIVTKFKYEVFFQEGPGIMASDFRETGIPLLRIHNVKPGYIDIEGCNYLEQSKVESKWRHFRVEVGDLIISGSATTGVVSEVDERARGSIPYTGLIRLKARTHRITKPYIKNLVVSDMFLAQIDLLKAGATIQHFGPTHLSQMTITLPPATEQRSIATEIARVSEKYARSILAAERAIELMNERRTALISAAVTGKIDVRSWRAEAQTAA